MARSTPGPEPNSHVHDGTKSISEGRQNGNSHIAIDSVPASPIKTGEGQLDIGDRTAAKRHRPPTARYHEAIKALAPAPDADTSGTESAGTEDGMLSPLSRVLDSPRRRVMDAKFRQAQLSANRDSAGDKQNGSPALPVSTRPIIPDVRPSDPKPKRGPSLSLHPPRPSRNDLSTSESHSTSSVPRTREPSPRTSPSRASKRTSQVGSSEAAQNGKSDRTLNKLAHDNASAPRNGVNGHSHRAGAENGPAKPATTSSGIKLKLLRPSLSGNATPGRADPAPKSESPAVPLIQSGKKSQISEKRQDGPAAWEDQAEVKPLAIRSSLHSPGMPGNSTTSDTPAPLRHSLPADPKTKSTKSQSKEQSATQGTAVAHVSGVALKLEPIASSAGIDATMVYTPATAQRCIEALEAANCSEFKSYVARNIRHLMNPNDKNGILIKVVELAHDKAWAMFADERKYVFHMETKKARKANEANTRALCQFPAMSAMAGAMGLGVGAPNGPMGLLKRRPFGSMTRTQKPISYPQASNVFGFLDESLDPTGKKITKHQPTIIGAKTTTWEDKDARVPKYTHCTFVSRNVATPNQSLLHVYPYFGDEVNENVYDALQNNYFVDMEDRWKIVPLMQKSRQFLSYANDLLDMLGLTEEHILWYLLSPEPAVGTKIERDRLCQEQFDRNGARWVECYRRLPKPDDRTLRMVREVCLAFKNKTGMSIWHVVRKSRHAKMDSDDAEERTRTKQPLLHQIQELSCTVCHEHDCTEHCQYTETLLREDNDSNVLDAIDIDWPLPNNVKQRATVRYQDNLNLADNITVGGTSTGTAYAELVAKMPEENVQYHDRYYPCDHDGKCSTATDCDCFANKRACEKACACEPACERRFKGCTCHTVHKRTVCYRDERCECYKAGRECDPDLCKGCRADLALDPVNRFNDAIQKACCHNVHMQVARPKRTLLGASKIHGFGVYAGEPIKKHDFVGEYKGETISQTEQIRRADVYHYLRMSYLFMLTNDQEVDSHHIGNKMRFINCARETGPRGACNVVPCVKLCNMTPRIAMFALRDIAVGEELFFDYGEFYELVGDGPAPPSNKIKGGRKKNARIKDFTEPEYEDDPSAPEGTVSKTVKARLPASRVKDHDSDSSSGPSMTKIAPRGADADADSSADEEEVIPVPRRKRGRDLEESEFEMDDSDEGPRKGGRRKKVRTGSEESEPARPSMRGRGGGRGGRGRGRGFGRGRGGRGRGGRGGGAGAAAAAV